MIQQSCENVRQAVETCDVGREMLGFIHREGGGNIIQGKQPFHLIHRRKLTGETNISADSPHFIDFSDGDKGVTPPALHPAKFSRSSAKVEQAPFEGLERLQALIYPQQRSRSGAGTPAPPSSKPTRSGRASPETQTPLLKQQQQHQEQQVQQSGRSRTPTTSRPPESNEHTPQRMQQQVSQPVQMSANVPARKTSQVEASETAQNSAAAQKPQPSNLAASASLYANAGPGSRTPSQVAVDDDERGGDSSTTAEKLQHMASQKRLSAAAFRGINPPSSPASMSPHYPYASNSPRQAKPYEPPPEGSTLQHSASAVLPPLNAPASPKKVEDPLLAALAKLRNPSSAVDVLSPQSPGVQGGMGTGPGRPFGANQQIQQQRGYSPYMQQPQGQLDGRRSPSQPISSQKHFSSGLASGGPPQRSQTNTDLPSSAQYSAPQNGGTAPSLRKPLSQSANLGGTQIPYGQQARSRPTSPNSGVHPSQQQIQRAPSPSAAMMRPPSQASGDVSNGQANYGQSFPGERSLNMAPPPRDQQYQSRSSSPAPPGQGLRSPPTVNSGSAGFTGAGQHGRASPAGGPRFSPAPPQGYQSSSPAPAGHGNQSPYTQSQAQQGYGRPQQRPVSAYTSPSQQPLPTSIRHRATSSYSGTGANFAPSSYGPSSVPAPQTQKVPARSLTPLGIALDASGQVTQDQMAEKYTAQYQRQHSGTPQQQQQEQPAYMYPGSHQAQQVYQPASTPIQNNSQDQATTGLPSSHQSAGYRRGASIYQQAQQQLQSRLSQQGGTSPSPGGMVHSSSVHSPMTSPYAPSPVQSGNPAPGRPNTFADIPGGYPHSGPDQQSQQQQQQLGNGRQHTNPDAQGMQNHYSQRSQSVAADLSGASNHVTPQKQGQAQQYAHGATYGGNASPQQASQEYGRNSPANSYGQPHGLGFPTPQQISRPSSAAAGPPTNQYTESGQSIQFYVRAIYKYEAQSPEEFSFQKDDVICVVDTAEDGWWTGELLDPDRAARSGGTSFPSNFVTLLE